MRWVNTIYSKKEVGRARETLINKFSTDQEFFYAIDVLSNWRAAHAYPMHSLLMTLRNQSLKIDKNAIVVQRLKRTPSIVEKLSRFPDMKLHRMQDISGCRSIINSVRNVELLATNIINSGTRHKLHKTDNYIDEPKNSGYRGIHLVYKYNGTKSEYQDYFVEIQLRSKIQHAWATAVEIVDTFTKQALKSSRGKQDWLDFFVYAAAQFAKLENRPIGIITEGINSHSELMRLAAKLNVIQRLSAFAVSADHIIKTNNNKTDYFLLELTDQARRIIITPFGRLQFEQATQNYLEKEKQAKTNPSYDVVLVLLCHKTWYDCNVIVTDRWQDGHSQGVQSLYGSFV